MEVVLISGTVPDVSVTSLMSILSDILVISNISQYWAEGTRNTTAGGTAPAVWLLLECSA
jgi:hypothetical protein